MGLEIEIGAVDYQQLRQHLSGEIEQVAFLFTEPYEDDGRLRVREIYLVPAEDFEYQSALHVALAEQVRPKLIKRAWDAEACLIEAHHHDQHGPVRFSPSDLWGLEEWVRHVRWRLRGRPYVALVFNRSGFDALAWVGEGDEPQAIEGLIVDGDRHLSPTNQTLRRLGEQERQDEH